MITHTAAKSYANRMSIVRYDRAFDPQAPGENTAFAEAVRDGLTSRPKTLPFQYFYDEAGSSLFVQICALREYYLTRTEDAILRADADAMVAGLPEPPVLIELGSGSAEKTHRLIEAALVHYGELHYVPIDVSGSAVEASALSIVKAFPAVRVTGVVGDYHEHLAGIAARFSGPKIVAFLGSSLGNYEPADAASLLDKVARVMSPNDRLLLGTDMAKDASIIEPAYDDSQGITARFNRNLLARINRDLRADFALDRFGHWAVYKPDLGRVEMHLVSLTEQQVTIPAASLTVRFAEGEFIHTENSHKYTLSTLKGLARQAGFAEERAWTDSRGWFRVQSWRPCPAR